MDREEKIRKEFESRGIDISVILDKFREFGKSNRFRSMLDAAAESAGRDNFGRIGALLEAFKLDDACADFIFGIAVASFFEGFQANNKTFSATTGDQAQEADNK